VPDDRRERLRREAEDWARLAPRVPEEWFARPSRLHGVTHTQRVHVHVQRLTAALGRHGGDAALALRAALWHDIGRTHDGVDDAHGARSAARAERLGLNRGLAPADGEAVLFAVRFHSLPDHAARASAGDASLPGDERALRVLWLLKDADALDRVRLGEQADPDVLRHDEARRLLELRFADILYAVLGP
jgi:HD superfamily phosphodiesterase